MSDIHTYYGDSYVLQGLSLRVPEGAVVGVLGRNGVGKTTLVRSIIGFNIPRRGQVVFEGRDVTRLPPHARVRLGMGLVPQGRRIFASLDVQENLGVAEHGPRSGGAAWTPERVLETFPNLRERRRTGGANLSGGEQQMLAVGRALVANARLLLLDEPTEGLSPTVVHTLADLIRTVSARGVSVLLVEQKIGFVRRVADSVYLMNRGRIVEEGRAADLLADAGILARYLGT